jgi:hypothetical protein
MIRYTVVWDSKLESQFTDLWVASDSATRTFLTEIANWVDSNLSEDPDLKGEYRADLAVRILAIPVSVPTVRVFLTYKESVPDRLVRVVRITIRT